MMLHTTVSTLRWSAITHYLFVPGEALVGRGRTFPRRKYDGDEGKVSHSLLHFGRSTRIMRCGGVNCVSNRRRGGGAARAAAAARFLRSSECSCLFLPSQLFAFCGGCGVACFCTTLHLPRCLSWAWFDNGCHLSVMLLGVGK